MHLLHPAKRFAVIRTTLFAPLALDFKNLLEQRGDTGMFNQDSEESPSAQRPAIQVNGGSMGLSGLLVSALLFQPVTQGQRLLIAACQIVGMHQIPHAAYIGAGGKIHPVALAGYAFKKQLSTYLDGPGEAIARFLQLIALQGNQTEVIVAFGIGV
jgi:hypothetical protein